MRAKGLKERSYQEGMPSRCASSGGTRYAPKHNPALYMWGGSDRTACASGDLPMGSNTSGQFLTDLANNTLPAFSLVTPDLCHDMHDCSVTTGDGFLKVLVPKILASAAYTSGGTALFIVWDEDSPIPNVVVAPSVKPGTVVTTTISHYSLLRATEGMLGLPLLLGAKTAADLRVPFQL